MDFSRVLFLIVLSFLCSSTIAEEVVEVYFITGQSNGGNFGELNSWDPQGYTGLNRDDANRTLQPFNLDFARIFDRSSNNPNTGLEEVFHQFSSPMLDTVQFATDRLALDLHTGADRMAIFSYCRNGRPLYNAPDDNGESWYPGDDPLNGIVFDDELYGHFKNWSTARIAELVSAGYVVDVKGIFWFQGEGDVGRGSVATSQYEQNYQRLVDRFRVDFGFDVKVIGTEIRVVGNANTQALQNEVNDALALVAAANPGVEVVTTQDLPPLDPGNVHFTAGAYYTLASRWATAFQPGNITGSEVVYQDSFDNDGLGTNSGIGGAGSSQGFNGGPTWDDDGDLSAGTAGSGANIWTFTSDESFDVSGGFTLEVVFDQTFDDNNGNSSAAPFNSNHFSFGLVTDYSGSGLFSTNGATPGAEAIGVSLTERFGNVDIGVIEWDLSAATTTTLDPITSSTIGQGQVFTLTVDVGGNYTWSLGNESASGTTNLDLLTQPFHFMARTQGSTGNKVQSVTFSATGGASPTIPPTSFTRFRGVEVSAQLSDFVSSDDVKATFRPGFTLNSSEAPLWLIFDGNDANASAIQVESTAVTPGLEYTVEAFNWTTSSFDVVGIQTETFNSDQVLQFPITAEHVSSACDLQTRIGWRTVGFTILFPWSVNIDEVVWAE